MLLSVTSEWNLLKLNKDSGCRIVDSLGCGGYRRLTEGKPTNTSYAYIRTHANRHVVDRFTMKCVIKTIKRDELVLSSN